MRFVVTGEWNRNRLLRLIVFLYLLYVLAFVATSALMYFDRMGLDPASVASYYLGDTEQEFGRPARSYSTMVADTHMHMFAMGMLVLVLTHLLLFVPLAPTVKFWLVLATFVFSFGNEASNWLVRFVGAEWAWVKIVCFVVMEVLFAWLALVLLSYLMRPTRNAYKDSAIARRPEGGSEGTV